jgi:hypothetical protein
VYASEPVSFVHAPRAKELTEQNIVSRQNNQLSRLRTKTVETIEVAISDGRFETMISVVEYSVDVVAIVRKELQENGYVTKVTHPVPTLSFLVITWR